MYVNDLEVSSKQVLVVLLDTKNDSQGFLVQLRVYICSALASVLDENPWKFV
jgi:hypothetical protein